MKLLLWKSDKLRNARFLAVADNSFGVSDALCHRNLAQISLAHILSIEP